MPADRWVPPQIFFIDPNDQPAAGVAVKRAYLVRIDGLPWAYADLYEIHKRPENAKAFLLDEALIEEDPNTAPDQPPVFLYRGAPPSPQ
jgi:hypothetical protein